MGTPESTTARRPTWPAPTRRRLLDRDLALPSQGASPTLRKALVFQALHYLVV
jgi:hypothetical protein